MTSNIFVQLHGFLILFRVHANTNHKKNYFFFPIQISFCRPNNHHKFKEYCLFIGLCFSLENVLNVFVYIYLSTFFYYSWDIWRLHTVIPITKKCVEGFFDRFLITFLLRTVFFWGYLYVCGCISPLKCNLKTLSIKNVSIVQVYPSLVTPFLIDTNFDRNYRITLYLLKHLLCCTTSLVNCTLLHSCCSMF